MAAVRTGRLPTCKPMELNHGRHSRSRTVRSEFRAALRHRVHVLEAVEAALKFGRRATCRPGLAFCSHAFHGLSYGALSLNGDAIFRDGFGRLLPYCHQIPLNDLDALEGTLTAITPKPCEQIGIPPHRDRLLAFRASRRAHPSKFLSVGLMSGSAATPAWTSASVMLRSRFQSVAGSVFEVVPGVSSSKRFGFTPCGRGNLHQAPFRQMLDHGVRQGGHRSAHRLCPQRWDARRGVPSASSDSTGQQVLRGPASPSFLWLAALGRVAYRCVSRLNCDNKRSLQA
jgi:hypothetical protein